MEHRVRVREREMVLGPPVMELFINRKQIRKRVGFEADGEFGEEGFVAEEGF